MVKLVKHRRNQGGFTLLEALVALAVITVISMVVVGALSPWIGLKQSIDTDRKLQDLKQGFRAHYEANAMAIETQGGGTFASFSTSVPNAARTCADQTAAFEQVSGKFSESPQQLAKDGYSNPWCFLISSALQESRDGVQLWYRNIAIVSTGRDGKLDPGTRMDAAGNVVTDPNGDDTAGVISGYDVQQTKLKETFKRLSRVASMYETYFTTRFLAYPDRDITRYYFSRGNGSGSYDTSGAVNTSASAWAPVNVALANIGVASIDAVTPWEQFSNIEVGNSDEQVNSVRVRSPATTGTGALPYTALLRARLPAPAGQTLYATQVVVGNY